MKENKRNEGETQTATEREEGKKHRKGGRKKREGSSAVTHCAALAFCPPFPSNWEIVRLGGTVLDSQDGK